MGENLSWTIIANGVVNYTSHSEAIRYYNRNKALGYYATISHLEKKVIVIQ